MNTAVPSTHRAGPTAARRQIRCLTPPPPRLVAVLSAGFQEAAGNDFPMGASSPWGAGNSFPRAVSSPWGAGNDFPRVVSSSWGAGNGFPRVMSSSWGAGNGFPRVVSSSRAAGNGFPMGVSGTHSAENRIAVHPGSGVPRTAGWARLLHPQTDQTHENLEV